jgi:hypothetical protein
MTNNYATKKHKKTQKKLVNISEISGEIKNQII